MLFFNANSVSSIKVSVATCQPYCPKNALEKQGGLHHVGYLDKDHNINSEENCPFRKLT